MLTLKAPVQLHIAQGLTGNAEAFSERIRGNYELFGARYTPKDLLFLLTAPPELPEETGGMTTLVNQNTQVDVRAVTMDVVNNVVNRIMLDSTQQFTYQDQVYITTVLNRLGVRNISQFMEQIRQLRVENESTVQLTKMYREKLEEVIRREHTGETAPSLPLPAERSEETKEHKEDPRVTMCMNILQRLGTSRLYETIHKFQRNWIGGLTQFQHNELRLAEQLRFQNTVALSEIKQQIYQQPEVHLLHHVNQYETGLLMETPRDEETVLSQAAVAALVNAVDNTMVSVLNRPNLKQEQWVHIENAIWQTAENTLSRFETYHSQSSLPVRTEESGMQAVWKYFEQERKQYQILYQSIYPKAEQYGRNVWNSFSWDVKMTHLEQIKEEQTLLQEEYRPLFVQNKPASSLSQIPDSRPATMTLRETEIVTPELLVEEQNNLAVQNSTVLEQLREKETQLRQESRTFSTQHKTDVLQLETLEGQPVTMTLRETETVTPELLVEEGNGNVQSSTVLEQLKEKQTLLREELRTISTQQKTDVLHSTTMEDRPATMTLRETEVVRPELLVEEGDVNVQNSAVLEQLQEKQTRLREELRTVHAQQKADVVQSPNLESYPVTMTLREVEEQAPELLVEELTRIDQRNRERMERVEQNVLQKEVSAPTGPDVRRTMQDALRALEEPETVLKEVFSKTETRMVHPDYTPQEEEILRQADPASRELYERILAYQRDPEGALAQGLVQPGNLGALRAEVQNILQKEMSVPMQTNIRQTLQNNLQETLRQENNLKTETTMVHPEYISQEKIFRQINPDGRELYEQILTYQKAPEGAMAQGAAGAGNLGGVHAQAQQRMQEQPLRLEHPTSLEEESAEFSSEGAGRILEQLRQMPGQRRTAQPIREQAPNVHFVHKQVASDVTQELLEQLEQQRTRSTVETVQDEVVTRQQVHQVDVKQIEQKVITQTTEDITELVNRTLSRQMRTISDQVYRQMEKRLQTERNRRGRW